MSSTFETVAGIIAETADIPRDQIAREPRHRRFGHRLLAFLDIAFAIDKAFGIKLPLEQWTQEVNEGKVPAEEYFVLKNLVSRVDALSSRPRTPDETLMRLEYFEMIDRVVAFDRDEKRIEARRRCRWRARSSKDTSGHPLIAGRAPDRDHGAGLGYLLLGLCDFTHMPFLMAVDKARFRSFVGPGAVLDIEASVEHEGSGYAGTKAKIVAGGKPLCDAELRFKTMPFPGPRRTDARPGPQDRPHRERPMTRDVVVTGIGLVSCAGEGVEAHLAALASGAAPRTNLETFAPFTVHPVVPLDLDQQIPKKSDQRQMEPWQRLGTYAAGLALDAAARRATRR